MQGKREIEKSTPRYMKTKMGGTHNERNVKTILGINSQCTCKPHFKTLGIMTLPS
jgi:hypothetical protein